MAKEDSVTFKGTIIEKFPSGMFSVKIDGSKDEDPPVLATLAGKLRMHKIRILAGDRVTVEVSPYDLTRGRITYRYQ